MLINSLGSIAEQKEYKLINFFSPEGRQTSFYASICSELKINKEF